MLITLPVFLPIVDAAGFDPIWFGVMFIIMMEIGYMTPPFGFNLFYFEGRGAARSDDGRDLLARWCPTCW